MKHNYRVTKDTISQKKCGSLSDIIVWTLASDLVIFFIGYNYEWGICYLAALGKI